MYSSRALAASDPHIRDSGAWGDCAGNTRKAIPEETQVKNLEKWKAVGGTATQMMAKPEASHGLVVAASTDAEPQPLQPSQHLLLSAGKEKAT